MTDLAKVDLAHTPFTWKTLITIADTEFVPKGLRGNPPAMLAAVNLGREIGLGPMQSMQMIDVIDGRPSLSAELQTALIREAGHSLMCSALSAEAVTVTGRRVDNGDDLEVTFTWDMATRAGLTQKRNWQQYPEAMLWARAVSRLARMLFADVFAAAHAYMPEELGDSSYVPDAVPEATQAVPVAPATGRAEDAPASVPLGALSVSDEFQAERLLRDELGAVPVDDAEIALQAVLAEVPTAGDMDAVEERLRRLCRIAQEMNLVALRPGTADWLHTLLADLRVNHVADLKRVELEALTDEAFRIVANAFTKRLAREHADG